MNLYNHAEWVRFREEIIRLDGGKCVQCDRSRADGVVLQVHHKSYAPGRSPWQYEHADCETLCKGCHAQEHGIIMPQSDWILIGSDDLGELSGECDDCATELRYVFLIMHPKWGVMAVGTDCCDRLTLTKEASEYHATVVKLRERRARFLSSKRWKEDSGVWSFKQKGIHVCICPDNGKFRVSMDGAKGKAEYDNLFDAKLRVFDTIESGEAADYLAKKRQNERANIDRMLAEMRRSTGAAQSPYGHRRV